MSHELWFRAPAPDWFEALPVGNGHLGAKVFGRVGAERIALNLDDVWSGDGPRELGVADGPATLADVRRLLLHDGDQLAATERTRALQGPLVESYQPLADLLIRTDGEAGDYRRRLDLRTGIVSVDHTVDGTRFRRETYVSTPDQVLVWTLTADRPGAVNLSLSLDSPHPVRPVVDGGTYGVVGHAPSDLTIEYRESPDPIRYVDGHGIGFGIALRVLCHGGTADVSTDGVVVRGADSVTVVLAAASTFAGWSVPPGRDPLVALRDAIDILDAVAEDKLRDRHLDDHRRLYERAELRLGSASELPTDERIKAVAAGGNDPDLVALTFNFGRYLLIASSRPGTQAANLQGIWNQDRRPMWASDWTNNINTQMNYWPADLTGLSECFEPLTDLLENLAASGANTARALYDAPGWVSHHNSDLWAATWPVGAGGDDPVWAMCATCGVWLTAHLMEHYRFGLDLDFLRDRAYPVIAGAAEFVLAMLVEDDGGRLQFIPSTAPEHHFVLPTGEKASVDLTSTYDIWLLRELFANLGEAEAALGLSSELAERARTARERLPEIGITADGRLHEWPHDWTPSEVNHRHQSHLYGLHPGAEIDPVRTPEWAEAARTSLLVRTDGATNGGWTAAWLVALWARLFEGERAAAVIQDYLARLVSDNLLHRDGDIFQIDANFGMTGCIPELLIQSHTDVVRLLPALPAGWPDGSFRGLRARGGLVFDVEWAGGRLTAATVVASRTGTRRIVMPGRDIVVNLVEGESVDLVRYA
ncbi:glycoside hydrolase family 95 protein [Kribbella sandramycini]|uniref:Alpha-L-fucosidase 2 n=1 Tax=Kribbella sandramycini TaxID=60450 RepID=A0A7Y4NXF0_9ACTN|nr:glycoside hydrolase family 95 protein [Kribbella sandramycini]MBB6568010.1 alpha-L-fucosidase 2 [Kribbella sandramycini]NOL39396.1 glycoside hydrolase family 95 protein [Kribbella sandramycini]